MAHIAKYKAASCGHMLAHYRRDASSLGRENIDPTRTKGNYTLGLDDRDGKVRAMNGIEPNWAIAMTGVMSVIRHTRAAAIDRRVAVSRRVNGRFSDYGAAWSALAQI